MYSQPVRCRGRSLDDMHREGEGGKTENQNMASRDVLEVSCSWRQLAGLSSMFCSAQAPPRPVLQWCLIWHLKGSMVARAPSVVSFLHSLAVRHPK